MKTFFLRNFAFSFFLAFIGLTISSSTYAISSSQPEFILTPGPLASQMEAAAHSKKVTPSLTPSLKPEPTVFRKKTKERLRILGLQLDVGIPHGAGLGLVVRPLQWLRLSAAGNYNVISGGIRGGLSLTLPFHYAVLPSANVEVGYLFKRSANWVVAGATGSPDFSSPILDQIGYLYVNTHLGIEFGTKRFTFFIHGGFSYLQTDLENVDATLKEFFTLPSNSQFHHPNSLRGSFNLYGSAKIGFIVYF